MNRGENRDEGLLLLSYYVWTRQRTMLYPCKYPIIFKGLSKAIINAGSCHATGWYATETMASICLHRSDERGGRVAWFLLGLAGLLISDWHPSLRRGRGKVCLPGYLRYSLCKGLP